MRRFYKENIVIKQLFKLSFVFSIIFAFYIQLCGEKSPGGGFQSGIIFSIICIIYELLFYVIDTIPEKKINTNFFVNISMIGILCYAFTGFSCILYNGNIFDYGVLSDNTIFGQQIGIFFIELGVCTSVFGSMMIIYRSLLANVIK